MTLEMAARDGMQPSLFFFWLLLRQKELLCLSSILTRAKLKLWPWKPYKWTKTYAWPFQMSDLSCFLSLPPLQSGRCRISGWWIHETTRASQGGRAGQWLTCPEPPEGDRCWHLGLGAAAATVDQPSLWSKLICYLIFYYFNYLPNRNNHTCLALSIICIIFE